MDDMQGGLREAQRLLESTRLDQQYQGNIAFFETVMPDAFEMLRGHEPSTMHLSYDEGGFVSLVRSHDNSPLYDGDPRACTEAQFAEYGRRPKLLASEGMRTPDFSGKAAKPQMHELLAGDFERWYVKKPQNDSA